MDSRKTFCVPLKMEELRAILSALDYQDADFGTYDDEPICWELKSKLEKLLNDGLND